MEISNMLIFILITSTSIFFYVNIKHTIENIFLVSKVNRETEIFRMHEF